LDLSAKVNPGPPLPPKLIVHPLSRSRVKVDGCESLLHAPDDGYLWVGLLDEGHFVFF
jgi:hypothetical protein